VQAWLRPTLSPNSRNTLRVTVGVTWSQSAENPRAEIASSIPDFGIVESVAGNRESNSLEHIHQRAVICSLRCRFHSSLRKSRRGYGCSNRVRWFASIPMVRLGCAQPWHTRCHGRTAETRELHGPRRDPRDSSVGVPAVASALIARRSDAMARFRFRGKDESEKTVIPPGRVCLRSFWV
jgi:hypothetical protein